MDEQLKKILLEQLNMMKKSNAYMTELIERLSSTTTEKEIKEIKVNMIHLLNTGFGAIDVIELGIKEG